MDEELRPVMDSVLARVLATASLRRTVSPVQRADVHAAQSDPLLERGDVEHDDAWRDADVRHLATTHHAAERPDGDPDQLRGLAVVDPRRHDATALHASGTTFAFAASSAAGGA